MAATITDEKQVAAQAAPDIELEELEETEEKFFAIPQLIAVLRWFEELIVAVSGYGIIFAVGVGVVDLLSDGQFTAQNTWIDLAYATSFAAAIAGQIIGLASRSSRSFNKGQWLRGSAYTLLVLVLAFTEYQASVIFGFHKAFGIPVSQSLQQLGIGAGDFIRLRAFVGIGLAVLSGYLRWQPTKRKSIAQLKKEAEYKKSVADMQAQQRADAIKRGAGLFGGLGQAARAAVAQATQTTIETPVAVAPVDSPAPSGDEEEKKTA